jgi:hypothetical protein
VNNERDKWYELLGVAPGASAQELKTAHRDMAKVWHPDRFAHDPRLRQKAQEKLKEINEAYDRLTSGRAEWHTRGNSSTHRPTDVSRPAIARRSRWPLILLGALVFSLLLFGVWRALTPLGQQQEQSSTALAEQAQTGGERQQSVSEVNAPVGGVSRGKRAEDQQSSRAAKTEGAPALEQGIAEARPLPTVTLMIDPATNMIATPACPVKSRMTYPAGVEPRQYCNASHQTDKPAPDAAVPTRPKESRLKSFAKRLAAPVKLLGGKSPEGASDKQEDKSPSDGGSRQNR